MYVCIYTYIMYYICIYNDVCMANEQYYCKKSNKKACQQIYRENKNKNKTRNKKANKQKKEDYEISKGKFQKYSRN